MSKCDQIRRKVRIWSHLLKKTFIKNFIFCAVRKSCLRLWRLKLFWSTFSRIRTEYGEIPGLNTERYPVSLRIQSECEKMRTRITPNTDTFYGATIPDFFLESIIATLVFYFFKSSQKPLKNLAKCLKWSFRLADWLDFYCYQKQYFCSCRIVLYSFFILGKKQ